MPDVLRILHKLWVVHSILLVIYEGTDVLIFSITLVRIDIGNVFQHVQPDFYAQLYPGKCIELEVIW